MMTVAAIVALATSAAATAKPAMEDLEILGVHPGDEASSVADKLATKGFAFQPARFSLSECDSSYEAVKEQYVRDRSTRILENSLSCTENFTKDKFTRVTVTYLYAPGKRRVVSALSYRFKSTETAVALKDRVAAKFGTPCYADAISGTYMWRTGPQCSAGEAGLKLQASEYHETKSLSLSTPMASVFAEELSRDVRNSLGDQPADL